LKKSHFRRGDEFRILCVGRITETKGQFVLLQALAEIVEDYPNFKAVFLGAPFGAETGFMDKCLTFVESRSLQDKVEFIGETSSTFDFYVNSHVVVVPSVQPEAFGKVLVEGMASSNIVIATSHGGPLEVIDHEINGFLVSPGSIEQLKDVLLRIVEESFDVVKMTLEAEKKAQNFNADRTGEKYFRFISRLGLF
jgi:glycosyltransferase involved in cell wall biosynthesis